MHTISPDNETSLEDERGRWENEGGGFEPAASLMPEKVDQALVAEPFPSVVAGKLDLKELDLVRLIDELQQQGLGEGGPVFLVTLFGATCSKIELLGWRKLKLPWHDYLAAMKRAIEREIGYWQNRETLLPTGEQRVIDVTVRDEDFTIP